MFYSVIQSENSTLQDLWKRQITLLQDGSFFEHVSGLLEKYSLPVPEKIVKMSREAWKLLVKQTLRVYWTKQFREEAGEKSTLEHCHLDSLHMGTTHPVWNTVKSNRMDVMRAVVKVRILTGTYLLQVHRKKFRMEGTVDACCPLCYIEDEDLVHMLTRCPALNIVRTRYINELKQCINSTLGPGEWARRITDSETLVQLIVDCRKLAPDILPNNTEFLDVIETKTRLLCYKVHLKRLYLCNINKGISSIDMVPDPPPIQ